MFNEAVTTIKGMRLNTKIQAGQCLMNFTKIKLGKGLHGEDELLEGLEALFEIQQEVSISRVEMMSENTVKISTVISNEGMEEGFYISEIGVFAEDPDEGEILYSVAVGTEGKMDYHPSYAEMSNYSLSLDMYIAVSNVEKISIDTVPGAAASAEELRELEKKVEALENVEFEDYTGEDSTPPDARTAISKLISGIAHNKFGEYVKAALMGLVTIGEMRGLLVNHGLCTEPGKFFLDAAYGKYLTDQITQLNSDLSKKKIEFTFADGVTHQAGDSYVIGKVAYISECINIAKDIPMGTKIITSLKIAGQAINCCFTYGNIIQSFNYIGCRCIVVESSITTESVIEIENGNYPSIIATCVLNV